MHGPAGWTKLGLIAATALLLAGDQVELDVDVGPAARLWLFDVAGTVAYDGRGAASSWSVRIRIADGGVLVFAGEPFVVAAGAEVERSTAIEVEGSGIALIRETVVLGRTREVGGRLGNRTTISRDGVPVLLEDQQLDPGLRRLPGVLGNERVLDTITAINTELTGGTFVLPEGTGTVRRWIGRDLAASPLHLAWPDVVQAAGVDRAADSGPAGPSGQVSTLVSDIKAESVRA